MSLPVEYHETANGSRFMVTQRALVLAAGTVIVSLPVALFARWAAPARGTAPIISADGRLYYIVALLVAVIAGLAIQSWGLPDQATRSVLFSQEAGRPRVWSRSTVWILPAILMAGLYALLAMYHDWRYVAVLTAMAGAGVFLILLVRRWLVRELSQANGNQLGRARLVHLLLTDAAVFASLGAVYLPKSGATLLAPAIFIICMLLLFQLTDGMYGTLAQRLLYAMIAGLIVVEFFWGLSYWNIPWVYGGALLLIVFHALARIVSVQLSSGAGRRDLVEYAGGGIVLFALVSVVAL